MSTRSTIAIELYNGCVAQTYCHWDGYLEHNGQILLQHYSDPDELTRLISMGKISSLAPEIGVKHEFDDGQRTMCTFYGRDRGDEDTDPEYFKDFDDYKDNHGYQDYDYILRADGQWYVSHFAEEYVLLEKELASVRNKV